MCINWFEKGKVEETKLERGHCDGGGKVEGWSEKHNLNVSFVSFSNLASICDLENGELQTETEDLLKEGSVRHMAHTGLFQASKRLSDHNLGTWMPSSYPLQNMA